MPISRIKTDGIQDNAITSAKIGDTNIDTADIADSSVTTAKIADANVTTAKIADANVTLAKLASDVSFDASTINSGNTSARAATPPAGTLYYNTDVDSVQIYNTKWNDIFTVPTLSAATGVLVVGHASTLTLTVVTDESTVDVEFRSGSTILATVTGVAVSSGSASVTVPSSVYNNITGGNSYTVRAKGEKGTRSAASQSFTARALASGGTLTIVGGYVYHEFLTSSTFTVPAGTSITDAEVVIVGGGGSGGTGSSGLGANDNGAGGGGGGVQHLTSQTLSVGSHTIEVGLGGAGVPAGTQNTAGNDGTQSSAFSSVAGFGNNNSGKTGGASGTPQSNAGGAGGSYAGGGGGGAGGAGAGGGANTKKDGGIGILKSNFTSWGAEAQTTTLTATPTTNGYFAGGGQGAGSGGDDKRSAGGGGASFPNGSAATAVNGLNAGVANTGGGGSGGYAQSNASGNGGSGIVLIRYSV